MASDIRLLPAALRPLRRLGEVWAVDAFSEILPFGDRRPPIPSRAAIARLRSSRSFFSSDTICPRFIDPLSRFGAIPGNTCSAVTLGLKDSIIARVVGVVVLALVSKIIFDTISTEALNHTVRSSAREKSAA